MMIDQTNTLYMVFLLVLPPLWCITNVLVCVFIRHFIVFSLRFFTYVSLPLKVVFFPLILLDKWK